MLYVTYIKHVLLRWCHTTICLVSGCNTRVSFLMQMFLLSGSQLGGFLYVHTPLVDNRSNFFTLSFYKFVHFSTFSEYFWSSCCTRFTSARVSHSQVIHKNTTTSENVLSPHILCVEDLSALPQHNTNLYFNNTGGSKINCSWHILIWPSKNYTIADKLTKTKY
jgi:hypothetical protein